MIHKYLLNGYHIVLDTNSGAVHLFDELPFQMLDYLEDGVPENPPEEMLLKLGEDPDFAETYAELRCV